ncbi:hypothetical protein PRIPAC_86385 [Pristionchus pacificus]|uniref:Uncharacterized protein n=1 Tax=Pristionchus pacificus TaxID=54126 RepID=A0A2A6BTC7_PRIPA|nr:hypothetical protein PRIPAC_86385 [Pristionchus pacificus]|eukprot:PDM69066.1 hypothetical protein PRIPAC_47368 [Pristionchus pacificus]
MGGGGLFHSPYRHLPCIPSPFSLLPLPTPRPATPPDWRAPPSACSASAQRESAAAQTASHLERRGILYPTDNRQGFFY